MKTQLLSIVISILCFILLLLSWKQSCCAWVLVRQSDRKRRSTTTTTTSSPTTRLDHSTIITSIGSTLHNNNQSIPASIPSPIKQNELNSEQNNNNNNNNNRYKSFAKRNIQNNHHYKLQGRLLKKMRQTCLDYNMLEDGDHIMVCVSGGKDSATLLHLLVLLQERLSSSKRLVQQQQHEVPSLFRITAVHVDQQQPGYNGTALVQWLQDEYKNRIANDIVFDYKVVQEDTYSVVVDKTQPGKSYCTVCSRLRRGILYSTAIQLGCNKIALGHHADDCLETLLLNMIHGGQMSAMPARYTSQRGSLAVMRPLIECFEDDIAEYATLSQFPILPCHLCSNQGGDAGAAVDFLQRPQIKLLLSSLEGLTLTAKQNMLNACQKVKPSHLLDRNLRQACGMDPVTGEVLLAGNVMKDNENDDDGLPI